MANDLSRRELFRRSLGYGSSAWLALNLPWPRALRAAEDEPLVRAVFNEAEWKTVAAVTARIIPTDEEPGAIEAGCVSFIDKALAHEEAAQKPVYAAGFAGLEAVSKRHFEKSFVDLEPGNQDEILSALASGHAEGWPDGPVKPEHFFETLRVHTIIGFLAYPAYGGNLDYAGWRVAGYPGTRHHEGGYTPEQFTGKEKIVAVWEKPRP